MSALPQASPAPRLLARDDHSRLRRELDRFDTVFFLISAMVVVDTIGAIAIGGAQAFTWLLVLLVAFFVPSALASAELGAAIPQEGGAYVWVRMAFGRFARRADVAALLGGHADVAGRLGHRARHRGRGALRSATSARSGRYAFGAAFIGAATLGAVVPLRFGKWVPTSGAIGQIVLLAFFTATVVAYGVRARRPRPRGRRHGSDLRGVHRRRAGPALLVRRHRAAVGRRGGDGGSRVATSRRPSRGPASARR